MTLEKQVERFWRIEGWDFTTDPQDVEMSLNDRKAVTMWDEGVLFLDSGHYQLPIPFKNAEPLFSIDQLQSKSWISWEES